MAILDKDNRPRGLRVPSLSAFKSRKAVDSDSSSPSPPAPPTPVVPPPAATAAPAPAPVTSPHYPVRTDSAPSRPPRPQHDRELPPSPLSSLPAAPGPLGPEEIHPAFRNEIAAVRSHQYGPIPNGNTHNRPLPASLSSQRTPSSEESVQPDAGDPLEDFIPDPEPEPEPLDSESCEENNGPFTPPEIEPVIVPLNKLHFACYQEHQKMLPANNVWYSLPCMTCQKFDREMRYRCVFCCLRICAACHQGLQKCPNRSLAEFMSSMPGNP
ncbi:uncharacterized protein ACLA_057540 [Aspergillus clavatus NRRL 1]|uniref:Uncharacterized protein n=1 Tax=Aspergillus clavatus (strain ATCC 1007 / CBS 513.65 / DSM 816 / NCTC 3887 / NRRL 1 / QM 1276 / 107) TaxID=344612 RepID=A1C3V8_ASPCL|nr:uncharacterized protein ACLA_057540 [Aspergillus clavatus NRRL 1]EAW15098.1 conserved hypothetical protein [Aspergillus clavatus NRRL 1]